MKLDFSNARIAVVGDAMVDIWHYGHWSKITGEGIPAFLIERTEERPGGAANVKANLKALGATAHLFAKDRALWPRKTRYSAQQTVFRADEEDCAPIPEGVQRAILEGLAAIPKPDVIVLSDYAKGTLTASLCQAVIGLGIPTIVDPKGSDWSKYYGAAVITPNWQEHGETRDDLSVEHTLLITDGAKGMHLCIPKQREIHIPATAREVYDVTGAGDTVVATLAACLAIGMPLPEAARIANAAAGVVVGKRGTATCSREELEAALA